SQGRKLLVLSNKSDRTTCTPSAMAIIKNRTRRITRAMATAVGVGAANHRLGEPTDHELCNRSILPTGVEAIQRHSAAVNLGHFTRPAHPLQQDQSSTWSMLQMPRCTQEFLRMGYSRSEIAV